MPRLRIYDSPNVHALTTNLYDTPIAQRYLKIVQEVPLRTARTEDQN